MSERAMTRSHVPRDRRSPHGSPPQGVLQRCTSTRECREYEDRRPSLQRRGENGSASFVIPPIVHTVLDSPGQPLDPQTRAFMESRFGYDFSQVRVHVDERATNSAQAVNALAYTVGRDVVFGIGQYAPGSSAGQRLLTHELTHVIQQGSTAFGKNDSIRMGVRDPLEIDAEAAEHGISMEPSVGIRGVLQRKEGPAEPSERFSDEELGRAGIIAIATTLRRIAENTENIRNMYNRGAARIEIEKARLMSSGTSESEIARRVSQMRAELSKEAREIGDAMLRKGAEAFDAVRGNVGRPTYDSLRAAGKTDAEIIASASHTNEFVNRLPKGLRWASRGLWIVSAGLSAYVVVSAPAEKRVKVATEEAGGLAGGAVGGELGAGICIALGVVTEGIGLLVCGLLGGLIGFEAGRRAPSMIEEGVRRELECEQNCERFTGWARAFCQRRCGGPPY